ncbi:hypothetical protein PG997_010964 [Apiospora hydei]|uniref:Uncharacterized protein n=1 Tax=Apiospora hydei TaxID=1337664 RepID=A0ABR1VKD1_9PEZI
MSSAGRARGRARVTKRRSGAPRFTEYVHYSRIEGITPWGSCSVEERNTLQQPSRYAIHHYLWGTLGWAMGNCFRRFDDDEINGDNNISHPAKDRNGSTRENEPQESGVPDTWIGNDDKGCNDDDYENIQMANQWMDDIDKTWNPTLQNWDRGAWTSHQGSPERPEARVAPSSPEGVSGIVSFDLTGKRQERKYQCGVSKKSPPKSRSRATLITTRVTAASSTTAAWCCSFEHRRETAHRRPKSSDAWLIGTPSTRPTVRGR